MDSEKREKKQYEPPRIVMTETLQGRTVACACGDETTCPGGPIAS